MYFIQGPENNVDWCKKWSCTLVMPCIGTFLENECTFKVVRKPILAIKEDLLLKLVRKQEE